MSDWELVSNTSKQPEWESVAAIPNQQESLLQSILKSPFKVGEDILNAGLGFAKNVPGYIEKGRQEIPRLGSTLKEHPVRLGNILGAGLSGMTFGLANLPHDIAQYGSERLNILPKSLPGMMHYDKPEDVKSTIEGLFGQPQYPGEEYGRSAIENIPLIGAGAKTAAVLNPLQYTSKNLAKGVLKTEKSLKEKYSGKKGLYQKLFNEADKAGASPQTNINPNAINFTALKKGTVSNKLDKTKSLSQGNITLNNAQQSLKELGFIERNMEKKGLANLLPFEADKYEAAKNAKSYIQENMFKDQAGNVMEPYLMKHKQLQSGYAKEYIPYGTNSAIQKFKRNEISAKELVQSLSKGKFAAQRGKYHPELSRKEKLIKALTATGLLGGTGFVGKSIYDYFNK